MEKRLNQTANPTAYLAPVLDILAAKWPENRTVNIVCHGHSVPAGYFATPFVNSQMAYPNLLQAAVKERFPFAVLNVIVTAIGGEDSASGLARFDADVLCHKPDVLTLDYGLNDRRIGLAEAEKAWRGMIETALAQGIKVILMTPSWEQSFFRRDENWQALTAHTAQIRALAAEYGVGLADSFACFAAEVKQDTDLIPLLSHMNHPSVVGHTIIARELSKFFLAR